MPKLQWLLIGSASVVAAHALRGAEATPRRHLRGSDDHRVLHTDDFTETVVDNQWLVLLGILLLMGSRSAWNYCLGRINSDLYVIEIKSFFFKLGVLSPNRTATSTAMP